MICSSDAGADGRPAGRREGLCERVRAAVVDSVSPAGECGDRRRQRRRDGKPSFITYASSRLDGLATAGAHGRARSRTHANPATSPNTTSRRWLNRSAHARRALIVCSGPIKYKGHAALKSELDTLKAALAVRAPPKRLCPRSRPPYRDDHAETDTIRRTKPTCSPSPRRCARNTRRSSMPASCSDRRPVPRHYYIMRPELSIAECRKWGEVRRRGAQRGL